MYEVNPDDETLNTHVDSVMVMVTNYFKANRLQIGTAISVNVSVYVSILNRIVDGLDEDEISNVCVQNLMAIEDGILYGKKRRNRKANDEVRAKNEYP